MVSTRRPRQQDAVQDGQSKTSDMVAGDIGATAPGICDEQLTWELNSAVHRYDTALDWRARDLEHEYGKDRRPDKVILPDQVTAYKRVNRKRLGRYKNVGEFVRLLHDWDEVLFKKTLQIEVHSIATSQAWRGLFPTKTHYEGWVRMLDMKARGLPRTAAYLASRTDRYIRKVRAAIQERRNRLGIGSSASGHSAPEGMDTRPDESEIDDTGDHDFMDPRHYLGPAPSQLELQLQKAYQTYEYESESDCDNKDLRQRIPQKSYKPKDRSDNRLATLMSTRATLFRGHPSLLSSSSDKPVDRFLGRPRRQIDDWFDAAAQPKKRHYMEALNDAWEKDHSEAVSGPSKRAKLGLTSDAPMAHDPLWSAVPPRPSRSNASRRQKPGHSDPTRPNSSRQSSLPQPAPRKSKREKIIEAEDALVDDFGDEAFANLKTRPDVWYRYIDDGSDVEMSDEN